MRHPYRGVVRLKTQALWRRLDELNGSQNWLAEEIGISKSYMSLLIRKEKAPSGRVRRRMMRRSASTDSMISSSLSILIEYPQLSPPSAR